MLEWECALKHPEEGAREGAPFIRRPHHPRAEQAFDDFAGSGTMWREAPLLGSAEEGGDDHRSGERRAAAPARHGGRRAGAFIGAVHRIAARLDDRFELVAGALSSDPDARAARR